MSSLLDYCEGGRDLHFNWYDGKQLESGIQENVVYITLYQNEARQKSDSYHIVEVYMNKAYVRSKIVGNSEVIISTIVLSYCTPFRFHF